MTELGIRWCLAGLLVLACGWLGQPSPMVALPIAGLIAATAWMRQRRPLDASSAGWFATFDATALLIILAEVGHLTNLAWLVALPLTDAVVRYRATGIRLGVLFAGIVMLVQLALVGTEPTFLLYAQLGGIYTLTLVLHRLHAERAVTPLNEPIIVDPDGLLALRENFRKLRDTYRQLDQRQQLDRLRAALLQARLAAPAKIAPQLSQVLRSELGADGVQLAWFRDDGNLEPLCHAGSIGFDFGRLQNLEAGRDVRAALESTLMARLDEAERASLSYATWPHDAPKGLILVRSDAKNASLLEAVAPLVGEIVDSAAVAAQQIGQLQRVELLFAISRAGRSSLGPESLAQRYVDLVRQWFGFDHLSVHLVDPEGDRVLAFSGPSIWLIDHLQFAGGSGVLGWLTEGHPTLIQPDATQDPGLDRAEGLRQRIGSYFLLPLRDANGCYGFLQGVNHEASVPQGESLELLRRTVEELNFGLRMQGVQSAAWGSLVMLEPIRSFSDREYDQLTRHIQMALPAGGVLRLHTNGAFIALLPRTDDRFLVRWALQFEGRGLRVRVLDSTPITAAVILEREPLGVANSLVS